MAAGIDSALLTLGVSLDDLGSVPEEQRPTWVLGRLAG